MRPDPATMSDCHLLDEYLTVYRDGGRRHAEIRAQLESRLAACDALRADLREAMELLQAHGEPPNWLRQAWLRREPGDDTTAFHAWNRRYGKLLAKHKETP